MGRLSTSSSTPTSLSDEQKASIDSELSNISQTGAKRLLLCDLSYDKKLSESDWVGSFLNTTYPKRRLNNYVKDIELAASCCAINQSIILTSGVKSVILQSE